MGVPHEERNISSNPTAKRQFLESGYDLLPVIEVGGATITEYESDAILLEALVREGYVR